MKMFRTNLLLLAILSLWGRSEAQESNQFLYWDEEAIIISMDQVLVKNIGADQRGFAQFAWRGASYTRQTAVGQPVVNAYQSWHLEIRTPDTIRSTTIVGATRAGEQGEVYELAFYRRSTPNPNNITDKLLWGKVTIPAERVKQVNNGKNRPFAFYSIDLVDVPYLLWRRVPRQLLDIRHIKYVAE
jgi:hypothetical protein